MSVKDQCQAIKIFLANVEGRCIWLDSVSGTNSLAACSAPSQPSALQVLSFTCALSHSGSLNNPLLIVI